MSTAGSSGGAKKKKAQGAVGAVNYDPVENGGSGNKREADGNETLNQVTEKADKVKAVLRDNLELAIDRGEKLDAMEEKSDRLRQDANRFNAGAAQAHRMFCMRNARMIAIIAVVVILLIAIIVVTSLNNK